MKLDHYILQPIHPHEFFLIFYSAKIVGDIEQPLRNIVAAVLLVFAIALASVVCGGLFVDA